MRSTSDGELSKLIKLRSHTIGEDLFYGDMEMREDSFWSCLGIALNL